MVGAIEQTIVLGKPKAGLLSGSLIGFVARVSGSFGTLLSGMVLARMLSPADLGVYMLLFNVVVVASILGTFGVGDAAIRFVGYSLSAGSARMAVRTALQALALGAAGMLAVAVAFPASRRLFVWWDPHFSIGWIEGVVIAGWIFAYGLLVHTGSVLRAFGEITSGTITESVLYRLGLVVAFGLVIATGQRSLMSVLIASTLVAVVSACIGLGLVSRIVVGLRSSARQEFATPGQSFERWKELLGVGLPLYGSALLFRLMGDGTIFIVDRFHGVDAVALYGGAYRLWVAFSLPQIAVNAALQPRLAMCASLNDPEGMERMMREASLLALAPTAVFALISLIAGGPLLSLLYGAHYAQGAGVLAILSISQLLCVIIGSSEHLMSMTGRHMAVLYVTVVCATISLLLAWILTPLFGLAGAAFSAGLSSVLFKLLLTWLAQRQLGVNTILPLRALRWGRAGKAH
jgi:O-antigen/teichoic acid export membrane protein